MIFHIQQRTQRSWLLWIQWVIFGLYLNFSSNCWATPAQDTLGAVDSSSPMSAGLSMTPSLSYFNPSHLVWSSEKMTVGLVGVQQRLNLSFRERPVGADISASIYRAKSIDIDPYVNERSVPLPSTTLKPRSLDEEAHQQFFLSTGLIKPLYKNQIVLGLFALIPLHRFEYQSPHHVDERAQYFDNKLKFERWGDQLEGLSATMGIGYRVTHQWSVGLNTTMLNQAIAHSQVFLSDASYQGLSVITPKVEVKSVFSPSFSVGWFRVFSTSKSVQNPLLSKEQQTTQSAFLTLHLPEEIKVEGQSQVKIWNYPYQDGQTAIIQEFTQVYRYLPLRVRWGFSSDLPRSKATASKWTFFTGGMWSQWSTYQSQHAEPAGWKDQFEGSIGFSWFQKQVQLSTDLRWRPSPVPHQWGRSSYVDPHQFTTVLSAGYMIHPQLSVGIATQFHYLPERSDIKDQRSLDPVIDEFPASVDQVTNEPLQESIGLQSNNPGYPGYDSQGMIWSGMLHLTWRPQIRDVDKKDQLK